MDQTENSEDDSREKRRLKQDGDERADLPAFQSEQRDGVSVVADKFYLEGRAVAMHQHRRAHIAAH